MSGVICVLVLLGYKLLCTCSGVFEKKGPRLVFSGFGWLAFGEDYAETLCIFVLSGFWVSNDDQSTIRDDHDVYFDHVCREAIS